MPAVPRAGERQGALHDDGNAVLVDVLHREHVNLRRRESGSSRASSRLRTPMSTVLIGANLRRCWPMRRELRRFVAEQRRERHAVHVAARGRRGRVHVAVRVDPDEPDRLAAARDEVRRGADRPGRKRVVAAEHEGKRAGGVRLVAPAGRVAGRPARFRGCTASSGRARPASRESGPPDRPCRRPCSPHGRQPLAEAGNADGRRAHVHASAATAEVERHAQDVDGAAEGEAHRRELWHLATSKRQVSACRELASNSARITVAVISLSGWRLTRNRADDLTAEAACPPSLSGPSGNSSSTTA